MYLAKTVVETFGHLEMLLKGEERVFYNRFGDGELLAIDHQQHRLRPEMTENVEREMADTFTIDHPHYVRGHCSGISEGKGDDVRTVCSACLQRGAGGYPSEVWAEGR